MITLNEAIEIMRKRHKADRSSHVERVKDLALEIAVANSIKDLDRVGIAAILHDYSKYFNEPHDLNGPFDVNRDLGINDPAILEAIRCHQCKVKAVGDIAKIVAIADASEEYRIFNYSHILDPIREEARQGNLGSAYEKLYEAVRDIDKQYKCMSMKKKKFLKQIGG